MKIETIAPGFAAVDLGSEAHYVAVADQPVKRFRSFTADLRRMAEWLLECGVHSVAMEATGVYWINPHDILEAAGLKVLLFDGGSARNLPGRKSDVQDCQWHAMLHSHGLLRPCFVPPEHIRKLRAYVRLREDHLESAATRVQHMQRALDLMNVRLHTVISQLHGMSGLRVIEAILAGERDPVALARLCDKSILKTKETDVIASLEGHWQEHHLFALRQALEAYRFCHEQVASCERQIEATLQEINAGRPLRSRVAGRKVKVSRHNRPKIERLYEHLWTMCDGHDAQLLPAIAPSTWLKIVGEVGTDLQRWPRADHFSNYLGLGGNRQRSGKRRWRGPRPKTRAGQIFREAVMSLQKTKDCPLGEFYRRIKARRGAPIAIVAAARKLAELYWRVMTKGMEYVDQGLAAYRQQQAQQQERALRRMAAKLGYTLEPLAAHAP